MTKELKMDHLQHDIDAEDRKPNHIRVIHYGAECEVLEIFEWPVNDDTYDLFFKLRGLGRQVYSREEKLTS